MSERVVRERVTEHRVDEIDRACLLRLEGELLRADVRDVVGDVRREAVGTDDRRPQCGCVGHGEAGSHAEREPEVVGGTKVRGVGDGDLDDLVVEEAHRQHLALVRVRLLQEPRGGRVDVHAREVDERDAVLSGERLGDVALAHPAAGDEDLADATARVALLGERLLDVTLGTDARAHEQLAELQGRRRRREDRSFHPSLYRRARTRS